MAFMLTFIPSSSVLRSRGAASLTQRPRWRVRPIISPSPRNRPSMSGVNGGIDYEIDLSKLPSTLASRVSYIQQGPDSPTELIAAAEEIASSSSTLPQLLPVLVDMLGFNNPVAANIAVEALSSAGSAALPSLLTGVAAFNYAVNAYALRALGNIGCPSVSDVCLACAIKGPIPNVRRAACCALGKLRFLNAGEAEHAYCSLLRLADSEPDWGVRYAAIVGLEHFYAEPLVPPHVLSDSLHVVHAAAEGRCGVSAWGESEKQASDPEKGEAGDPTVAARASVAFDVMARRLKSVNVSLQDSVLSV